MKAIKALLYIVLLVISPDIFAGIFDPPPTDKSVSLLGMIFGSNIGNIYLGGKASPVLSDIMEKFNFFIVVAGTIVVSYVGIMSTINTAQEGTAMGKKWSAVWIPMRSIAGMSLMIPSPASGYSMIQVTVMWIIIQGIGAADQLWNIALDGLSAGVSASAGTAMADNSNYQASDMVDKGSVLAKHILDAAICMETLYQTSKSQANQTQGTNGGPTWLGKNGTYIKNFTVNNSEVPSYYDGNSIYNQGNIDSIKITGTSYFGVEDDANPQYYDICGKIPVTAEIKVDEYPDPSQITYAQVLKDTQRAYEAKMLAISTMLSILRPLAQGLVIQSAPPYDANDKADFKTPKEGAPQDPPGYALAAAQAYASILGTLVIPDSGQGTDSRTKGIIKAGKENGWITAGSFYFVLNKTLLSKQFNTAQDSMIVEDDFIASCNENCKTSAYANNLKINPFSLEETNRLKAKGITQDEDIKALGNYLAQGSVYMKEDKEQSSSTQTALGAPPQGLPNEVKDLMGPANTAGSNAVRDMMNIMDSGEGDPLLAHSVLGKKIMLGAEGAWIAITIIGLATSTMLGVGSLGILSGVSTMLLGLLATISTFLGALWALGASLAIYMPLVPFMIFTMAAIGWLLTVIEAIIAAPLIALGLVTPSGDELGKLEHALMLLANIFLRPMLMIFGFLLAGRLYKAAITLIDFGMADVFKTIDVVTIFSSVVIMFLYVTFVLSITNVCFSLIYAVPDKILRWMGGHAESTNADISETKSGVQKMSQSIGSDASAGASVGGNKAVGISNANAAEQRSSGQGKAASFFKGGSAKKSDGGDKGGGKTGGNTP